RFSRDRSSDVCSSDLKLAEESVKRNLKVGVGLMCRHCVVRQELFDRIKSGQIGDLVTLRAYRQTSPVGSCFSLPNKGNLKGLLRSEERRVGKEWRAG